MLARDLGMTVEELSARMDYREYVRWQEFYTVEEVETKRMMKRAQDGKSE